MVLSVWWPWPLWFVGYVDIRTCTCAKIKNKRCELTLQTDRYDSENATAGAVSLNITKVYQQTRKYGTGLRSLSSIGVSQSEELIDVIRLEEPPLFGIFQNTIGQKLFEDLPEIQQTKKES